MRTVLSLLCLSAAAAFAQTPTVTSVYNQYSYSTSLCPGLLAIVAGTNFGSNAANVTVTVGNQPAYIFGNSFYFTSTAFSVQIPFNLTPGQYNLVVTVSGTPSTAFPVTLAAASPAFSAPNGAASGPAYAFEASGAQVTYAAPAHGGDTVTVYAVGLGVTSPAAPTGTLPAGQLYQVVPLPKVTVGGVNCAVAFAGGFSNGPAVYQINFTAPSGVQGAQPLVVTVGNISSSSMITLPMAGLSAVVNNASFANPGTIAPGSIASVFANGLGNATTVETSGVFPATSSEGLQVTFGGTAAPIFHLIPSAAPANAQSQGSSGQIDLEVPTNLPTTGTVNVQLTTSSADYQTYTLNMVPASPGLYRFTDSKTSSQYAIVQFANSAWVVLPVAATSDIGLPACASSTNFLVECGEPANIGDYLVIYLTGLGQATVNGSPTGAILPTGQNPPANGSTLYETPTLPAVTIGGVNATVSFSGVVPGFAGEYQIDVQVPTGVASGDSVPVVVTMMGQSDTANISIQPSRVKPPNQ